MMSIPLFCSFLAIFGCVFASSPEQTTCIAEVDDGLAVGVNSMSENRHRICKYLGLPYAVPPIGELRFEPPVEFRWSGIRNFVEKPEICPQPINIEKGDDATIEGSEDCLTLSVYTPLNTTKLLPVFFWIHGGSFFIGSQDSSHSGFDYIVEKDVVVVSINYRLNTLGFLSVPELNITGNLGMKDQILALKWVQRNIASFGGNPRKVTIVGWSAGAASATYHLYSKQSKGLFSRVISMSGTLLNPWAFLQRPSWCRKNFLEHTGFQTKEQLKNASFTDLMPRLHSKFMFSYFGSYHFCFIPTIEAPGSSKRFLKKSPLQLTRKSPVSQVPLLIGYTTHESEFFTPDLNYYMSHMNFANNNKTILEKVQNFIENFTENTDDNERRVILRLNSIADTLFGVREFTKKYAEKSKKAVYAYRFDFDGRFAHFKPQYPKKYRQRKVAMHGDDLGYLFVPFFEDISGYSFNASSPEVIVSQRMVEMWTNFVKFGNPTPAINDVITTKWRPYNEKSEILNIDEKLEMIEDPFTNDPLYEFWSNIYDCLHKCRCALLETAMN
ncbi:esterase E4-like [Culicoides brevitarsis]|uniref:esterase E4-like n=1 Tax=Culicoides brevitarsis TaxID=469753 RepID=UPI00307B5307